MRTLFTILLVGLVVNIFGCRKQEKPSRLVYCDGLITDTTGTNDNGRVFFPSAFSPNGDGLNDILRPITQNISYISFTIWDDYNNVIFSTSVPGEGWRTSLIPNASVMYYYRIQATTTAQRKIGLCGIVYKLTCYPKNVVRTNLYFEDQLTPMGFTGITNETLGDCP